ncbi:MULTISPECIES: amino acid ABC transporter substrate-binding protein [unclassified Brevundimonas]|uniref:amino acid ABC transporter substrate-binding protein n=1 Tax=unclassified Brevundimonas TaxID=2622653 RepID=UPI0025BFE05E|nr:MULTISPECIES: amino acid ABC transporter substrate-binding protein [unclassified Brevundimonas]
MQVTSVACRALGFATLAACLVLAGCKPEADPQQQTSVPAAASDLPEIVHSSPTLLRVKARGHLICGVHEGLVGFAYTDNRGQWRGFDVDFCRATAAAVLGDANAVRYIPLSSAQRFNALKEGRVDVLWRNTSWTMSRDTGGDLVFAGINYYDGQGFLVRRALNLSSATELNGARICVHGSSTSELNAEDYFRTRGIDVRSVVASSEEEARQIYAREGCDALTGDVSALAAARSLMSDPRQHVVLPEVISKEPLGPVVRAGDERWAAVVRWVLNALISAEELGVTKATAKTIKEGEGASAVQRLLGYEGDFGPRLGLGRTWARDAIAAEGNYGEIFEKNIGTQSPLDLERGLNAQWSSAQGGLIYGLPIR